MISRIGQAILRAWDAYCAMSLRVFYISIGWIGGCLFTAAAGIVVPAFAKGIFGMVT